MFEINDIVLLDVTKISNRELNEIDLSVDSFEDYSILTGRITTLYDQDTYGYNDDYKDTVLVVFINSEPAWSKNTVWSWWVKTKWLKLIAKAAPIHMSMVWTEQ